LETKCQLHYSSILKVKEAWLCPGKTLLEILKNFPGTTFNFLSIEENNTVEDWGSNSGKYA